MQTDQPSLCCLLLKLVNLRKYKKQLQDNLFFRIGEFMLSFELSTDVLRSLIFLHQTL